jgi:arginyl-tRNA--protein-N-Asp/Glu arginylyltransferase
MSSLEEEYFLCWRAEPGRMDELWAEGWRHFGEVFFRYRRWEYGGRNLDITPLRIDLGRFAPSRSQRRVLARNRDLRAGVRPTVLDAELRAMFAAHKRRFREGAPHALRNFFSYEPSEVPCRNETVCVYAGARLVAAHFLDVDVEATSAVYAMFDPAESRRSLGVYTMLLAVEHSRRTGRRYYYPGYGTREPSPYDYKRNFAGLEEYDWRGGWHPVERGGAH